MSYETVSKSSCADTGACFEFVFCCVRAEERGGGGHTVADRGGNGDGRDHDREELLDGGEDDHSYRGLVLDVVNEINCWLHFHFYLSK